jgi:hypothetical protein
MAAINTAITIRMNAPMTNFEPMALSSLPSRNRKEESRELPRARPASKASTVRGSYASPQVPSGSPISRDVPHSGIGPRVNAISECEKGIDVKPLGVSAYMQYSVCECWGFPMRVERNVMGGLLAIIAIGFVAIVVGGFLS